MKKTKKKSQKSAAVKDIWPQERDFLTRPERFRYVRKLVRPDGCVFCHSREAGVGLDSLCLYADQDHMVVLNKYPYNTGHLMVLPAKHVGDFISLSTDVVAKMSSAIQKCMSVLQKVYQPDGFNVGMNHGAVAGAGIPEHLHWHIVPRWSGDTNFFPLIAETKVLPETLEQSYAKLKEHF